MRCVQARLDKIILVPAGDAGELHLVAQFHDLAHEKCQLLVFARRAGPQQQIRVRACCAKRRPIHVPHLVRIEIAAIGVTCPSVERSLRVLEMQLVLRMAVERRTIVGHVKRHWFPRHRRRITVWQRARPAIYHRRVLDVRAVRIPVAVVGEESFFFAQFLAVPHLRRRQVLLKYLPALHVKTLECDAVERLDIDHARDRARTIRRRARSANHIHEADVPQ